MKNKILSYSVLVGLLTVTSMYLVSPVYAETNVTTRKTLIQTLIEKLNLNKESVDNVVNEYRQNRQTERLNTITDRLTKAVTDGKITEDQKNKIIAKVIEWQSNKTNWQELSRDEKQAQIKKHQDEMVKWAEDNNIDIKYLVGFGEGPYKRVYKQGYKAGQSN